MKVNLASGQRPFPEPWVNVDIRDQGYKVDVIADANELPFKGNSVDILVAHHLFEHIQLDNQKEYITEWWRVLKPQGILAVFVPNMRKIARRWLNNEIDTFIYCVNAHGAYQGYETDLHRWSYDGKELVDRITCGGEFDWLAHEVNLANPLYEGADIAWDWWVLSKEFVKNG